MVVLHLVHDLRNLRSSRALVVLYGKGAGVLIAD